MSMKSEEGGDGEVIPEDGGEVGEEALVTGHW